MQSSAIAMVCDCRRVRIEPKTEVETNLFKIAHVLPKELRPSHSRACSPKQRYTATIRSPPGGRLGR
jgi:hypothetical protein